jgi:hypothetical protein
MAHFAEIDNNGLVLRVLVVGNDQEQRGQDFLSEDLNLGGIWIQTSYNGNIRKRFAGIGYTYDSQHDVFLYPKCHEQAILETYDFTWLCENEDHLIEAQTF